MCYKRYSGIFIPLYSLQKCSLYKTYTSMYYVIKTYYVSNLCLFANILFVRFSKRLCNIMIYEWDFPLLEKPVQYRLNGQI